MGANEVLLFLVLGLAAGVLSGLIGIGGGILIVPALVFIFGMDQHQAQGTTLAMMVPPIGILAAWTYYKSGHADIKVAGVLCVGFFFGGLFGARAANLISSPVIEKIFGAALLLISLKMMFSK